MKDILITSSVLIPAILLIRFLFRGTISRRTQYALWLLVALRLLIPVHLPAIEHNVLSAAEQTETVQNIEALRGVDQIWHTESGPVEGFERGGILPDTPVTVAKDVAPERFARMQTVLAVRNVLKPLWHVGMLAMALWFLTANLRFFRALRRTRVPLEGAESKYPVYLCDDIPSPCLFGLFRPAIYVTSAAARDGSSLRCVIAHEETHARHLDPLWSLLRGVCLVVYWFDPLVWLAAYCAKADCELACDEGALARLGESERMPYGKTLLSLIPVRRGGDPMLAATTMTAGKRQMKERIERIAKRRRPAAAALILALALSGAACAATFTGPARQADEASQPSAVTPELAKAYLAVMDELAAHLGYAETEASEGERLHGGFVRDWDGDGVPELCLLLKTSPRESGGWDGTPLYGWYPPTLFLYTYRDGRAVRAGECDLYFATGGREAVILALTDESGTQLVRWEHDALAEETRVYCSALADGALQRTEPPAGATETAERAETAREFLDALGDGAAELLLYNNSGEAKIEVPANARELRAELAAKVS